MAPKKRTSPRLASTKRTSSRESSSRESSPKKSSPKKSPPKKAAPKKTKERRDSADALLAAIEETPKDAKRSSMIVRGALAQRLKEAGCLVNPDQVPPKIGGWSFLETADQQDAADMDYHDEVAVTKARQNRDIGTGLDEPSVYFTPGIVNPERQPAGAGRWVYTSEGEGMSRELAWINVGGQGDWGFADIPHPTAQQIWELRRSIADRGGTFDPTTEVDIAWIPQIDGGDTDAAQPGKEEDKNDDTPTPDKKIVDESGADEDEDPTVDTISGLTHDPLNGGDNDQTGGYPSTRYRTHMINGRARTIDISTAQLNRVEPHKSWICTDDGKWQQYKFYGEIDWAVPKSVKRLQSWRDQARKRQGWPKQRKRREDYTDAELAWVWDVIRNAEGKVPRGKEITKLTEEFNRRWEAKRARAGISACLARVAKEFKEGGGERKEKKKRGQAVSEAAEKLRKKRKRERGEASSEDEEEEEK